MGEQAAMTATRKTQKLPPYREAERAARKWARSLGADFKLAPPELQNFSLGAFEDGWLAGYEAARADER